MNSPRPRRLAAIVVLGAIGVFSYCALRSPWSPDDFKDLRDSVGERTIMLSAGHATLSCMSCHLRHQSRAAQPLWSTFGPPASASLQGFQVGGPKTELCLSCHDGTVAAFTSAHLLGSAIGGNLNAPHPVGVDYRAAYLRNPDSYIEPMMNPKIILEEGKVSCVSCHSVHDLANVTAGSVRHEVCIECHRR